MEVSRKGAKEAKAQRMVLADVILSGILQTHFDDRILSEGSVHT